jgi:hypothetical protein
MSSGASSERSATSNPAHQESIKDLFSGTACHTSICRVQNFLEQGKTGIIPNLHAVDGNPPKTDTGLVGAVGHIHFICSRAKDNE